MPPRLQPIVSLWFLYTCLQKSDYKSIDFNAVAKATGSTPSAAKMRFSRLRNEIEHGGIDDGTATNSKPRSKARDITSPAKEETNSEATSSGLISQNGFPGSNAESKTGLSQFQYSVSEGPFSLEHRTMTDASGVSNKSPGGLACEVTNGIDYDRDDDVPLAIRRNFLNCSQKRAMETTALPPVGNKRCKGTVRASLSNASPIPVAEPSTTTPSGNCMDVEGIRPSPDSDETPILGSQPNMKPQISFVNDDKCADQFFTSYSTEPTVTETGSRHEYYNPRQNEQVNPCSTRYSDRTTGEAIPNLKDFARSYPDFNLEKNTPTTNGTRVHQDGIRQTKLLRDDFHQHRLFQCGPKRNGFAKDTDYSHGSMGINAADGNYLTHHDRRRNPFPRPSLRSYRLPSITVTDVDSDSPRNTLNSDITMAIGNRERFINQVLFGTYSSAPANQDISGTYLSVPQAACEKDSTVSSY